MASSSRAWWLAPSGPTESPPCAPPNFTFRLLRHIVVLICSHARPERNTPYVVANGMWPVSERPAATFTMFCSAIPRL
mgnify:CR=1 FL=1